jgi:hypothetical protein
MLMTPWEREKLKDCAMLVRSAKTLLDRVDPLHLPEIIEIRKCFESADEALTSALGA